MPEVGWVRCGAMDQDSSDGRASASSPQVWRYPVKSMMGERLDSVTLGPEGVVGDRTWAVRDEVLGGIRGAKKLHGLMGFAARYTAEPPAEQVIDVEITLPDGTTLSTGAADASEQVSKALDHPITLWPLQPKDDLDHYRRGRSDSTDPMGELRAMFALEPDDPLPDLSVFPRELMEFESPPGTYVDAFPLLVMTEQSLASLHGRAAGVDHRCPALPPEHPPVGRRRRLSRAGLGGPAAAGRRGDRGDRRRAVRGV